MLGWRYSPENALCCAFGAIRLVSVRKSNDCLVVAFDYRCNDPYSTIQLWIGDIDTVQYVTSTGRLIDVLRQSCPLNQILIRHLIEVPCKHNVC